MVKDEMQKSTLYCSAPALAELVEDKRIHGLKLGYDATKKEVNTSLFNIIREDILDTGQQGKVDLWLTRSVDTLSRSER